MKTVAEVEEESVGVKEIEQHLIRQLFNYQIIR